MKILIVAHPDDEVIWFSPASFDLIVIAFLSRHDKHYMKKNRELAIAEHPLNEKIILLDINESGFWKDHRRVNEHKQSHKMLINSLALINEKYTVSEIFTHNAEGEYGHDDHILVHKVVLSTFKETDIFCPLESKNSVRKEDILSIKNDLNFYNKVKLIYEKNKAWTWKNNYLPPNELNYRLNVGIKNDTC